MASRRPLDPPGGCPVTPARATGTTGRYPRSFLLSHTTTEHNAFTIWPGAKLAATWYEDWADVLRIKDGEWLDCRLLAYGKLTNPRQREASNRTIRSGDLVVFDYGLVGPLVYSTGSLPCRSSRSQSPSAQRVPSGARTCPIGVRSRIPTPGRSSPGLSRPRGP